MPSDDIKEYQAQAQAEIEKEWTAYGIEGGASAYLGGALSVRSLRRLIGQSGGLPYYQVGRGKILISRADLDAWLAGRRHEPLDLEALADQALRELGK